MIRRPPRSTQSRSSAASDVYKRQRVDCGEENWEVDDQERAFGDEVPAKRSLSLPEAPEGQHESGKQGEKAGEAPLEASWGADSEDLPKDDPQIGGRHVNLEALGHVLLSPDEDPSKASRVADAVSYTHLTLPTIYSV